MKPRRGILTAVAGIVLAMSLQAQAVTIGAGSGIAGATNVDSGGVRLNVDQINTVNLAAGSYNVTDSSFSYSSGTDGEIIPFLAISTGVNAYEVIWTDGAIVLAQGAGIHTENYAGESFTLAGPETVYAGIWHDGVAKVRFNGDATLTGHDNSPATPDSVGVDLTGFSHPSLNNRTYAFEVNVELATSVIPEPATATIAMLGLGSLMMRRRRNVA